MNNFACALFSCARRIPPHVDSDDWESEKKSIEKCRIILNNFVVSKNVPGLTVAVIRRGKCIWSEGIGYCDLEANVACRPNSIMRIGSISKSITAVVAAKLIDKGLLDIDMPIQHYLPDFPSKKVDGEEVVITIRHIMSNTSGIRHYIDRGEGVTDVDTEEMYLNKRFTSSSDALAIFSNDDILHKPGSSYSYSTHAWTVLTAVIERITGLAMDQVYAELFEAVDMRDTCLDYPERVTPNRSRFYMYDESKRLLVHARAVDNSWKWAGGGLLSTAADVALFGDYLLRTCNNEDEEVSSNDRFLSRKTLMMLWKAQANTKCGWDKSARYGLGFCVPPENLDGVISHTGGSVGGTSVLHIEPMSHLVVAVVTNQGRAGGVAQLGREIAREFR